MEINYIIFLFFWLFRSMDILTSFIQFEECLCVLFKYYFVWYRLCVCTNVGFDITFVFVPMLVLISPLCLYQCWFWYRLCVCTNVGFDITFVFVPMLVLISPLCLYQYWFCYRLCVCTNVGFVTILSNACLLCNSVVNWKMHRHRTIKIQKCSSGSQFIHWNLLSLFKCLSHRKSCNIPKNVTKLISVRKKSYTFSKYLMPSILKYIIHISYIFSFSF